MKKKSLLSTILLVVGLSAYTVLNTSYSGGFGSYSNTACVTCHGNGMPNTSMTINNLPATYAHGQSYPISVTVSDMTQKLIAGFQLRSTIGTFSSTDPAITVYPGGLSLGHNSPKLLAGGTATFSMTWTAPSTGNAVANFGAQGIAANGNNSNSGDAGALITVSNIVLPVRFIDISAIAKTNSIEVNFETKDEENIKSFTVQKSLNGIDFDNIEVIAPKGSGFYKTIDLDAKKDITYYYRIQELSTDSKSTFSKIVTAKVSAENKLQILPTNISRTWRINGLQQDSDVRFTLYDLTGRPIKQINEVTNQVELTNTPTGIYIAAIAQDNNLVLVQKIYIK